MTLDLTAPVGTLAAAATDLTRLLPARIIEPALAGVLVRADSGGIQLAGTDRERAVLRTVPGVVHGAGRALVPARPLAETLRAVEEVEVRLSVEGSRLAVRTPGGRFALPLLDADSHPGVLPEPPPAGSVPADALIGALAPVAGAASREDALPVFTGVRLHARGADLELLATDRYRMAVARVPWRAVGRATTPDVLVPAALLTEITRQAPKTGEITLHVDADRMALSWPGRASAPPSSRRRSRTSGRSGYSTPTSPPPSGPKRMRSPEPCAGPRRTPVHRGWSTSGSPTGRSGCPAGIRRPASPRRR